MLFEVQVSVCVRMSFEAHKNDTMTHCHVYAPGFVAKIFLKWI